MNPRILFFHHYMPGLKAAWKEHGFQVWESDRKTEELSLADLKEYICSYCRRYGIQFVFSFDFSPDLAEVCRQLDLIYISWIVDCPHAPLWTREARYPSGFIFEFDNAQHQRLRSHGNDRIWYLPLAADGDYFQDVIQADAGHSKKRYGSDIAFLGNLYMDAKHNLYDQISYLPPWLRGYLDALIGAQQKIWGGYILEDAVSAEAWEMLKQYVKWELGERYDEEVYEVSMANILSHKTAQLERKEVCSYLARHFDFALYTGADTSFDPAIQNKGYADYLTQMPLIFQYSKININITLHSISSGIPLRVLDVLACGGFLLTNYQHEIAEYFEDGKELVIYSDFQDMYEKIAYYLEHEEERLRIALAGCRKVNENFTYRQGVERILQVLEEEGIMVKKEK